jgi:DNA-binding response OmpR family regulator
MRRIAIVEDDPNIGPMISRALKLEGFEPTVINDGKTAARRVSSGGYSAAILDVMLPGKDGIEVLHELRAAAETKDLPVVMLSAKSDPMTTWDGWREGANYYMTKPFDPEELVKVLRRVMDAGGSADNTI